MQIDDELLQSLNKTFEASYGFDADRTNAIDIMQQKVSFIVLLQFKSSDRARTNAFFLLESQGLTGFAENGINSVHLVVQMLRSRAFRGLALQRVDAVG